MLQRLPLLQIAKQDKRFSLLEKQSNHLAAFFFCVNLNILSRCIVQSLNCSYSLRQLIGLVDGRFVGDPEHIVTNIANLKQADSTSIAYCTDMHAASLEQIEAGVLIVPESLADKCRANKIVVANSRLAFAMLLQKLFSMPKPTQTQVADTARVHPSVSIANRVTVMDYVIISKNCSLADGVVLHPGVVIKEGVCIGENTIVGPNVTLYQGTHIGDDCKIHAGAVIGKEGFGYERDSEQAWIHMPQLGKVIIGDRVEVGANATIDRGALEDTIIRDGVKIDNAVHIGHNCHIKQDVLMCAQVGLSGTTTIGARSILAGRVASADHVTVVDDVLLTGNTVVRQDILSPGQYAGDPAQPLMDWLKQQSLMKRLGKLFKRVKKIEDIK